MSQQDCNIRIGLVLSAGGLRGAAHLGVLKQLTDHGIHVDVIVGASVGAIIGAYYAAVGLTVDGMRRDASIFRGRHLLAHSLGAKAWRPLQPLINAWRGVIPVRLAQLKTARFDRLHHRLRAFGVVCHDLTSQCPRYLSSVDSGGVCLHDAVVASASIPGMFRPSAVTYRGQPVEFTDGAVSDPLPIEFAGDPGLEASHLIISDCRQRAVPVDENHRRIYLRPQLDGTTTLRAPRSTLLEAVTAGENAVTETVLARVRAWSSARL